MPAVPAFPTMLRALALLAAIAFPGPAPAATALPRDLAQAVAQLEKSLHDDPRRVSAPDLDPYLQAILCRLDPARCGGLRTVILREPGFNASIAPGGLIVLRTGALLRCHDEAELALVLAHEMAHEQRGDAHRRWQRGEAGLGRERGGHPREAEAAADAAALAMLAASGYDVAAGERLWTRLLAEERALAPRRRMSDPTHPPAAERLAAFRDAYGRLGGPTPLEGAGDTGGQRWRQHSAPYRPAWLEDEVARGRPDATVVMLEAAGASAEGASALDVFALAQVLRRRDSPGDRARAEALYARAIGQPDAPAAAWREHGLARIAAGDGAGAEAALAQYLDREPMAADAEFVAAMLAGATPPLREGRTTPRPARSGTEIRAFDLRLSTPLRWIRQRGIGMEQWTLDGVDKNRLLVVPGLRPGEPLFRDAGRSGPRHRPGLRADEIRDQVVAALDAAGWLDVRADGPRRHRFGDVPGWSSNLSLASAAGVRYRGSFAFVERDRRLTLLLWFAAAEVYFPRDAAAVETMLASVEIAD